MMKKISLILLLFIIVPMGMKAQAGIKVYTLNDSAKFQIVLNGELENVIPIKEHTYDSLAHNVRHKLVISFKEDSIADIEQGVMLLENQVREFEILKKKDIRKKTSKVGRKIGKLLRIGKHEKDEILYDVYYLEERTKSKYMDD